MGETENFGDWFEVPGYRLKSADTAGEINADRIRSNLEKSGVFQDGQLRSAVLETKLRGGVV